MEARLLRAIQETPAHHYNVEDLCPQCLAESRQNTLKYNRTRPGYEPVFWKDMDYFQKRVPSMDSINRKSLTYQRSANGSSSDVSHLYEYISDYPYALSYNSTGRSSSHSPKLYSRTNSLRKNNTQNVVNTNPATESESASRQYQNKEKNGFNLKPSRRSVTSIHSKYEDRSPYPQYWTEKSPYQPSGSDSSTYQTNVCDKSIYQRFNSGIPPDLITDSGANQQSDKSLEKDQIKNNISPVTGDEKAEDSKLIRGYKYSFNPSYYDAKTKSKTLTENVTPKRDNGQSNAEDSSPGGGIGKSRQKRKGKSRRKSSDSFNSNCTESTSLSGSYNANVFRKDRNNIGGTNTLNK